MSKSVIGFRAWPIAAVLGLGFLAYTAGSQQSLGFVAATPLRVQYIPAPTDIVNLAEGTPYTVPAGQVLIITDWVTTDAEVGFYSGNSHPRIHPHIQVDGVIVWGGGFASNWQNTVGGHSGGVLSGTLHSGVRVNAGQTVSLATVYTTGTYVGTPTTFASGYLAKDS